MRIPILLLLISFYSVVAAGEVDREIEDGILDWIHLHTEAPAQDSVVVVRLFDATETDLGTGAEGGKPKHVAAAERMQAEAPGLVAEETAKYVTKHGPFPKAFVDSGDSLPDNALIIEGRFTTLDPGSKAKRYFAGFGAGKGVMEIEGRVVNAAGEMLAEFRQRRLTVMGAFGGSYDKKMRADSERFGEDIAKFLQAWSLGKNLE